MKKLTKQWHKDYELGMFLGNIETQTPRKQIPLVFFNGGTEKIIDGKSLRTVKTNLNVTEKENELTFMLLPDTFFYLPVSDDDTEPEMQTYENQFLNQYLNRLRVISYLPEKVLKTVKDKRMLALGFADDDFKNALAEFIGNRYDKAINVWENSNEASEKVARELSASKQFKKFPYPQSFNNLLQESTVSEIRKSGGEIRITLDLETITLTEAETVLEECSPENAYVWAYELYKNGNRYELHFLLSKKDENFIDSLYYAQYSFKDLLLED